MTPHRALAGLGLKPQMLDDVIAQGLQLDFVEIHAENAMVAGGPLRRAYERMREHWPMSVHGVGLSIGGEEPLDRAHLERLADVVRRLEPEWVSEHLAWSSHGGVYFADLLPVVYDTATLQRVHDHVDQVQERLGRRVLIENPSRYFDFAASTYDEARFLAELVRRSGCGLLVDVNNAHVSALNNGTDAVAALRALPVAAIGEIHLAGHAVERGADGAELLIDTHGAAVAEVVWALYRDLLARSGPVPTLIERDRDLPAPSVLAAEVAQARVALEATAGFRRAA